jgi:hypothetical protein
VAKHISAVAERASVRVLVTAPERWRVQEQSAIECELLIIYNLPNGRRLLYV